MREQVLKSDLMKDLTFILHFLGNKENLKEEEERIFENALSLIKLLVPKKSSVNISVELDSILDELILAKQRFSILKCNEYFWTFTTLRLAYPIS